MVEIVVPESIVQSMSVLWVQKMYTFYRMFDEDGKGFFIKAEADEAFRKRAARLLKAEEVEGSRKAGEAVFNLFFKPASISHGGRTVVTWADYIRERARVSTEERKNDEKKLQNLLATFFTFMDLNEDGTLDPYEIKAAETIFGLTPREANLNFVSVNKRCDGQVTLELYTDTWCQFFYSTAWDDSTLAFGRLLSVNVHVTNPDSIKYRAKVPQDILTNMGELWVRKMLTLFRHYDVDGTGVLDWDSMCKVTLVRTQSRFTTAVCEAIRGSKLQEKFYNYSLDPAAIEEGGKKVVKWANFLKQRYAAANENRATDEKVLVDLHETEIQAADMNKDAAIQLEEYIILAQLRGLTQHQSIMSFANMDLNGDGHINYSEGLEAQKLFYYSKEFDEGTLLYGTLDNARLEAA